jgi:hypothetical protein
MNVPDGICARALDTPPCGRGTRRGEAGAVYTNDLIVSRDYWRKRKIRASIAL